VQNTDTCSQPINTNLWVPGHVQQKPAHTGKGGTTGSMLGSSPLTSRARSLAPSLCHAPGPATTPRKAAHLPCHSRPVLCSSNAATCMQAHHPHCLFPQFCVLGGLGSVGSGSPTRACHPFWGKPLAQQGHPPALPQQAWRPAAALSEQHACGHTTLTGPAQPPTCLATAGPAPAAPRCSLIGAACVRPHHPHWPSAAAHLPGHSRPRARCAQLQPDRSSMRAATPPSLAQRGRPPARPQQVQRPLRPAAASQQQGSHAMVIRPRALQAQRALVPARGEEVLLQHTAAAGAVEAMLRVRV